MPKLLDWKQDLEEIGTVADESLGFGKQDLMNQEKWRELLELLSDAIDEEEERAFKNGILLHF